MDEPVPQPDAVLIVPMTREPGIDTGPAPTRPPRRRLSRWLIGVLVVALAVLGGAIAVARKGADEQRAAQARHDQAQQALDDQNTQTDAVHDALTSIHDRMKAVDDGLQPTNGAMADVSRAAGEDADLSAQVEQALQSNSAHAYNGVVDPANAKIRQFTDAVNKLYALLDPESSTSTVAFG